ncbi:MAG: nucleoside monophosphate kinase, partial [Bacteroidales bacterium]|nr:nucleoside monophosphate kinase [Bacteroidales bacterium]
MFNLIIFGPPGSGKGTQSIKIAEKYGLIHISTGDIFRNEIRNKTEIGLKVKSIT